MQGIGVNVFNNQVISNLSSDGISGNMQVVNDGFFGVFDVSSFRFN